LTLLFRAEARVFAFREDDFALLALDLEGRAFALADRVVFLAVRTLALPPLRALVAFFRGRTALTARFARGTAARAVFATILAPRAACRAVRLIAGIIGLSLSARLPIAAPITPPTTAPTGPATAPTTAPVAAPAVVFEIGGISMFSLESDSAALDCWLVAMGFWWKERGFIPSLQPINRSSPRAWPVA